ncbi:hypothetical protein KC365_g4825 [Hortaea werneckii]|nr:hypothetical protein KC342_g8014 [Hortaea werneckii]KAI7237306.1 hypothetical protein KC365_g4825 [Hortaea werneckii]
MSGRGTSVIVDAHNFHTGTDGGGTIGNNSDLKAATSEQFGHLWRQPAYRQMLQSMEFEPQVPVNWTVAPGNGYTGALVWTNASVSNNGTFPQYAPSSTHLDMNHCIMPHGRATLAPGTLFGPASVEYIEPGEGMEFNTKWLQLLKPRIKS